MSITLIAAISRTRVIADSKNPGMLWHNKAELQHFRNETVGKTCIVGFKTAINMPILKDRQVYVIICGEIPDVVSFPENYHFVLPDFKDSDYFKWLNEVENEEIMVIGGAKTYQMFMDIADRAVISVVWDDVLGDIYLPNFEGYWALKDVKVDLDNQFTTERYERVKADQPLSDSL